MKRRQCTNRGQVPYRKRLLGRLIGVLTLIPFKSTNFLLLIMLYRKGSGKSIFFLVKFSGITLQELGKCLYIEGVNLIDNWN